MTSGEVTATKKRKEPPTVPSKTPQNGRGPKRARTLDARKIATQSSNKALKEGELDVQKFVKAREFEIRALEEGMRGAKKVLTTRAFQSVPRHLRRRTASHNVKRVPKRLRRRAAKEMKEDNTPTVSARSRKPRTLQARLRVETAKKMTKLGRLGKAKRTTESEPGQTEMPKSERKTKNDLLDVIANAPTPRAAFHKRQKDKTWLPTHIFHAKRAHMTPPKQPLWRFAIPLSPNEKVYRLTHKATSSRGAVAWDMSYLSTISLEGAEESVEGVLSALAYEPSKRLRAKCKAGTRAWSGWLFDKSSGSNLPIAPATVIYRAPDPISGHERMEDVPVIRKALIRVHPAAFLQLWNYLLPLSKSLTRPVKVQDLRYEIGSIELTGPGSTEALVGTLWPTEPKETPESEELSSGMSWKRLAGVTNAAALPENALLCFDITDPRLHYPPRTIFHNKEPAKEEEVLEMLSSWPPDRYQTPSRFFSNKDRTSACRGMLSQRSIDRRKREAPPGDYPEPLASDPSIPIMLFASRPATKNAQGRWTLLLPWKYAPPVWYSLIHYPLSTGETVRFGGLNEKRQTCFERGEAWFPADYIGTKAGDEWETKQRQERKKEWEKRPKGKRVEWNKLDLKNGESGEIGDGRSCDWERLLGLRPAPEEATDRVDAPEVSSETSADMLSKLGLLHVPSKVAMQLLAQAKSGLAIDGYGRAVSTIKIQMLSRGTLKACARIYRIPTDDDANARKWLDLASSQTRAGKAKSGHSSNRDQFLQASNQEDPVVPREKDLIGYVTTGNYCLSDGVSVGIGSILLSRIGSGTSSDRFCIVRDAGLETARLARWEFI